MNLCESDRISPAWLSHPFSLSLQILHGRETHLWQSLLVGQTRSTPSQNHRWAGESSPVTQVTEEISLGDFLSILP